MTMIKTTITSESILARAAANEILIKISVLRGRCDAYQQAAIAEKERINARYQELLQPLQAALAKNDRAIKRLMKGETAILFDGADKVKLADGILLHTTDTKVSIPRDALEKIEAAGWPAGIRIAKSVNRPVVEAWPDEKMVVIGAKKKVVDKFAYEVLTDAR